MDNTPTAAPIIPAGTGNTIFGGASFNADGTPFVGAEKIGQAAQVPVAGKSEGVKNESPKVPQEPASQTTPSAWEELASKKGFKSPDDMATAYQNLEQKLSVVGTSLSELIRARAEGETPAPQPENASSREVRTEGFSEPNTTEEALRIVDNLISKKVRPLEDRLALQDLFLGQSDARDYATEMAQIVKKYPGTPWELAYRAAKSDAVEAKARQAGREEAQVIAQQRVAAQVGGTIGAANQQQPSLQEIITDRSIPFSEVQRIVKERLSQTA